jgi:hypothetical protein
MRTPMLFLFCLMLMSLIAAAQNNPTAMPARSQASSHATNNQTTGPISVRGCVNGDKGTYTLTQKGTGAVFALQGNDALWQSLRGKPVEVTATEAPPLTASAVLPQLAVSDVHAVDGECAWAEGGKTAAPTSPVPDNLPAARSSADRNVQNDATATPEFASPGGDNQTPPSVGNNPNVAGESGAPSPGTGNPPPPKQ